jgi:HAE1 family hydrophobic/amphiphilic exporter-1
MMWLTNTAVAKPLAIVAIFMAVVAAGIASFFALPINLFPKFNVPVVVVTTVWAGASPNEVELQITRGGRMPWRACRASTHPASTQGRASRRW